MVSESCRKDSQVCVKLSPSGEDFLQRVALGFIVLCCGTQTSSQARSERYPTRQVGATGSVTPLRTEIICNSDRLSVLQGN